MSEFELDPDVVIDRAKDRAREHGNGGWRIDWDEFRYPVAEIISQTQARKAATQSVLDIANREAALDLPSEEYSALYSQRISILKQNHMIDREDAVEITFLGRQGRISLMAEKNRTRFIVAKAIRRMRPYAMRDFPDEAITPGELQNGLLSVRLVEGEGRREEIKFREDYGNKPLTERITPYLPQSEAEEDMDDDSFLKFLTAVRWAIASYKTDVGEALCRQFETCKDPRLACITAVDMYNLLAWTSKEALEAQESSLATRGDTFLVEINEILRSTSATTDIWTLLGQAS